MNTMKIYNPYQAFFFIKNGVEVSDVYFHPRGSYIEFVRNNHTEKVFTAWMERKRP